MAFHIALNLAKYYALCFALFLAKCISLYFVNKEMVQLHLALPEWQTGNLVVNLQQMCGKLVKLVNCSKLW